VPPLLHIGEHVVGIGYLLESLLIHTCLPLLVCIWVVLLCEGIEGALDFGLARRLRNAQSLVVVDPRVEIYLG
jgi:hypothetical protein